MPRGKGRITGRAWVLTLDDIGGRLQDVVGRWLLLVEKLRFVGPVLFSEIANPSPVQDARFFHFAGCLEAFHREVVQADAGKFLPREEYREITKSLLNHLPPTVQEPLREAMRSALSHANDRSFAERTEALFNSLEAETQRQLADEPQRFLAAIKRSRNKIAHVAEATPGETFQGKEFAHANISIRGWLTILMLKECGVSESLILRKMAGTNYFYWGPFAFEPRSA